MRVCGFIILLFYSLSVFSASLNEVDADIKNVVSSLLQRQSQKSVKKYLVNNECHNISGDITLLLSCSAYLKRTYITSDIDAYTSYINELASYKFTPEEINAFSKVIDTEYDKVISKLYFKLAETYYHQGQYELAISTLKKIDDTLDDASVYHALLIYGLIYSERGEYKQAKYYLNRITEDSEDYKYARYNMALISMRSSWWSEAEGYLNEAIQQIDLKKTSREDSDLLDRIFLTLGYSKINRKDFRGAKESFSSVSLDGTLSNRALLGLSMAEIGLGELSQAAPVLKHVIKNAKFTDKIDALVILPQVYQHANNTKLTVSYYKSALKTLDNYLTDTNISDVDTASSWESHEFVFRINRIEILEKLPYLNKKERKVLGKAKKILVTIQKKSSRETKSRIRNRVKNYISQIKYALAVIYDDSVAHND